MKGAIEGALVTIAIVGTIGWGLVNREGKPNLAPPADVIILPNGVPFVAQPGSADRALIDWLSIPQSGECRLALGPSQFQRGSEEPTRTFRKRIEKLVLILRSFGNIRVGLQLAPGAGQGWDDGLADRRSAWVLGAIRDAGSASPRLIGDHSKNRSIVADCPSPGRHGQHGFMLVIKRVGTR